LISGQRIVGRLKLQKIVYLAQEFIRTSSGGHSNLDYPFDFYRYGVFSKSLAMDASFLSRETCYLSEEPPPIEDKYGPWIYVVSINDPNEFPELDQMFGNQVENLKRYINVLNSQEGRFLECISTIVYLCNSDGFSYPSELCHGDRSFNKLYREVTVLKPHLMDENYDVLFLESIDMARNFVSRELIRV